MTVRWGLNVLVGAVLCTAAPLAADTQAGVDAWEAGDYEAAVREWEGPAAMGDPDAMFNLGQAYRMGRGVETDTVKAEELYAAAAAKGNLRAADNYGILMYLRGERKAAFGLLQGAASRNDPRAYYLLGTAYFNGDGTERDWPRAYGYMTLASRAGLPQASDALTNMEENLPPEDKVSGLKLVPALAQGGDMATTNVASAESPAVRQMPEGGLSSEWKVQLGAFAVNGNVERMWRKVSGRPELAGKTRLDEPAGKLTVLYATGFANLAEARRACRSLKRGKVECLVTR
ncbi:sporulation protein [Erythrobacter litoralis]|uniref:SPOR domain-containing protein n=1 Tax=Erythrobacter litoralis TaxID=39960 RepID=UPI002434D8BA|nr:SPOR domain-containing protein [Erythrobacter litoralis]MDG6078040.1 sporulation protein [Erythrobacter litoralis]